MGTLDTELHARDVAGWNHVKAHEPRYTPQQLKDETDDMLDALRSNGRRITDAIYGEGLDCKEAFTLGDVLAAIMSCRRDDLDEHVEALRTLFARPLLNKAQEMATEYLENGDED